MSSKDLSPSFSSYELTVPGSSRTEVKGPECRAHIRPRGDIISVEFLMRPGRPGFRDDFKMATYEPIWTAVLGSDVNTVSSEREAVLESAYAIEERTHGRAGRRGLGPHARRVRGRDVFHLRPDGSFDAKALPRLYIWSGTRALKW